MNLGFYLPFKLEADLLKETRFSCFICIKISAVPEIIALWLAKLAGEDRALFHCTEVVPQFVTAMACAVYSVASL